MVKLEGENESEFGLKFKAEGDWKKVVSVCERIDTLLSNIKPEDIGNDITDEELDNLKEDWDCWKPCEEDEYSCEMREKTAEQSSVDEINRSENENIEESMEKAAESVKKVPVDVGNGKLKKAKNHLSESVRETGKIVNSKVRDGLRKVEEKIYEKVILKVNSLYFDKSVLNAILSKKINAEPSEEYELTIHSNNTYLRKLMADEIKWDEK